jgi:hypothetical protein
MNPNTRPADMYAKIKSEYGPLPEKPSGVKTLFTMIAVALAYVFVAIPVINMLGDMKSLYHFIVFIVVGGFLWTQFTTYSDGKRAYEKEVEQREKTRLHYEQMQHWYDGERHKNATGGGYKMYGKTDTKYPVDWQERRKYVMERDGHCFLCHGRRKLSGDYKLQHEVHHVQPISKGGTHDVANLVYLCSLCHEDQHEHLLSRRITTLKTNPRRASKNFPKWLWAEDAEKRLESLKKFREATPGFFLHRYTDTSASS